MLHLPEAASLPASVYKASSLTLTPAITDRWVIFLTTAAKPAVSLSATAGSAAFHLPRGVTGFFVSTLADPSRSAALNANFTRRSSPE